MGQKNDIKKYLRENVNENRYKHILGVRKTAVMLGEIYYKDSSYKNKRKFLSDLALAALLHDVDKNIDGEILWKNIKKSKMYSTKFLSEVKDFPALYHSLSGRITAIEKFKITNTAVLDAITYHTTGFKGMDTLGKIIYLSDFIEPSRDFKGIDKIRKLAKIDLDEALILATKTNIKFLRENNSKVNKFTLEFLEELKG